MTETNDRTSALINMIKTPWYNEEIAPRYLSIVEAINDSSVQANWLAVAKELIEQYVSPIKAKTISTGRSYQYGSNYFYHLSGRSTNIPSRISPYSWSDVFSTLLKRFDDPLDIDVEIPMLFREIPQISWMRRGFEPEYYSITHKNAAPLMWVRDDCEVFRLLHSRGARLVSGSPETVLFYCPEDLCKLLFEINGWDLGSLGFSQPDHLKEIMMGSCSPYAFDVLLEKGLIEEKDFSFSKYADTELVSSILSRKADRSVSSTKVDSYIISAIDRADARAVELFFTKCKFRDPSIRELSRYFASTDRSDAIYLKARELFDNLLSSMPSKEKPSSPEKSAGQSFAERSNRLISDFHKGDFSLLPELPRFLCRIRPIEVVGLFECVCALGTADEVERFCDIVTVIEYTGSGFCLANTLNNDDVVNVLKSKRLTNKKKPKRAKFIGDTKGNYERRLRAYTARNEMLASGEIRLDESYQTMDDRTLVLGRQ